MLTARSAVGGRTWVRTVAVLLTGLKLGWSEVTVAVELDWPELIARQVTVAVAAESAGMGPRSNVTMPLEKLQEPWDGEAVTNWRRLKGIN